jgi:two-component system, LytTR family, response regulator
MRKLRFCFDIEKVILLEGDRNYTKFILETNCEYLTSINLGKYEQSLEGYFLRIHKKYIINCKFIKAFDQDKREILMKGGRVIKVARRNKNAILLLHYFERSPLAAERYWETIQSPDH